MPPVDRVRPSEQPKKETRPEQPEQPEMKTQPEPPPFDYLRNRTSSSNDLSPGGEVNEGKGRGKHARSRENFPLKIDTSAAKAERTIPRQDGMWRHFPHGPKEWGTSRLEQTMRTMQGSIDIMKKELPHLEKMFAEKDKEFLADYKEEIQEKEQKLASFRGLVQNRDSIEMRIGEMRPEIDSKRKTLPLYEKASSSRPEFLTRYRTDMANKETELQNLEKQLQDLNTKIDAFLPKPLKETSPLKSSASQRPKLEYLGPPTADAAHPDRNRVERTEAE